MEYAWRAGESDLDRVNRLAVQKIATDAQLSIAQAQADATKSAGLGKFLGTVASGYLQQSGFINLGGITS